MLYFGDSLIWNFTFNDDQKKSFFSNDNKTTQINKIWTPKTVAITKFFRSSKWKKNSEKKKISKIKHTKWSKQKQDNLFVIVIFFFFYFDVFCVQQMASSNFNKRARLGWRGCVNLYKSSKKKSDYFFLFPHTKTVFFRVFCYACAN